MVSLTSAPPHILAAAVSGMSVRDLVNQNAMSAPLDLLQSVRPLQAVLLGEET